MRTISRTDEEFADADDKNVLIFRSPEGQIVTPFAQILASLKEVIITISVLIIIIVIILPQIISS